AAVLPVLPASSYAKELSWVQLPTAATGSSEARRPCPRYEHGAALVGHRLYVVAGNYAGHTVTVWGSKLYIMGGHAKGKAQTSGLPVYVYDTADNTLATLINGRVWVFGGEDSGRRPLAHAAAAYLDRYLLIFGGGSTATCYADVAVLDTEVVFPGGGTCAAWLSVSVIGHKVSPRAGHSGAVVGSAWYVVGGGNNIKELAAAQKQAEVAVSEAAAAKEGAAHELALLRKQLATCQAQLDMAARAVEEARGASQRESSRVMRLEAEAAELQRRLAVQEAAEAAAKKGSGGLWGFIAGSSTAS
ncbi:ACB domain-containing protein, partial [Haematococcus lacustris]